MSEAAAAVRWLLQQEEPEARRVAVQQIAKVKERDCAELLLRALGDDDWRVRKEATTIAPQVERREEVVAALVAALEDNINIGLRNAAVDALVAIGSDAVGAVVESIARLDADAQKLAVEVLGGVPDARGTAALTRSLADEDANVRVAAAEALGNAALAGEDVRGSATRALVASLATSDTFLKIAALDSLARLEAMLPWSTFEPFARDPLLRRYAIAAAAGSREPDAVRALAQAIGDSSPTIAREAVVALGDLVARASEPDDAQLLEIAREALAEGAAALANARRMALDAEDTRARGGALLVLGLGRDVVDVPVLVEALAEDDVAERADLAVRLFGAAAAGPLLGSARFASPQVRAAALSIASSLEGAEVAVVRAALREALEERSFEVRVAALDAIGPLGDDDDLRRVAAFVDDEDERVAATAIIAVSELAARHVDAARALLRQSARPEGERTETTNVSARSEGERTETTNASARDPLALGCILLGAIASTRALGDDDVRILERALAHDDPRVRRAAVDALARAGGDAAGDAVVFALADEEHEVQLAAVRALGKLGRAEPLAGVVRDTRDPVLTATALRALGDADPARALAAAQPLVTHADAAIACAAIEAIGPLASSPRASPHLQSECEEALFSALDHPDPEAVKLVLSIVGVRPGPRALARLGLSLDHPSWEVRRVAAELLGQDRSSAAQALLRARYEREKDPIVREAIAAAVSERPPSFSPRAPQAGD